METLISNQLPGWAHATPALASHPTNNFDNINELDQSRPFPPVEGLSQS
jgi:hypothetical protein